MSRAALTQDVGAKPDPWRGFVRRLVGATTCLVGALFAFVLTADPYGTRVGPGRAPTAIMDLNGRFMFPQLARSGLFDSAVFGTSTVRLLDPRALDEAFGGRFANLGLNAGTPWEQLELAKLLLQHVPSPKTLIFGLDRTWCDPAADAPDKRVTFRSFPPWLYDEGWLNDLPELVSLKSLEIAGRVALRGLGLMPERVRGDGYEVFTPPEESYDLARARAHIWSGAAATPAAVQPDKAAPADPEGSRRLPALTWLRGVLDALPASTRAILVLPPIHVAAQAAPGSSDAAQDRACKADLAAIGRLRGALTLDLRLPSPVTREDANYWDSLHYRQPVARLIVAALKASADGLEAQDGFYRVLAPLR